MTAKIESAKKRANELLYELMGNDYDEHAVALVVSWIEARDEQIRAEGMKAAADICDRQARELHKYYALDGAAHARECANQIRAEIERRGHNNKGGAE